MRNSADIRLAIVALEQELAAVLQEERRVAVEKIQAIMQAASMTVADLQPILHKPPRNPRPELPPKYRNTDGRTWTGQGRMPKWLQGQKLADFLITPPA